MAQKSKKDIHIVSWNVNGLNARLVTKTHLEDFLFGVDADGNKHEVDILCLQETKTPYGTEEEKVQLKVKPTKRKTKMTEKKAKQAILSEKIKCKFPYRFWQSTHGTTQRKGLSGTAIWSSIKPIREIPPPEIEEQGRITAVEFPNFNLVSVYTPNSGSQAHYRGGAWHLMFCEFISSLRQIKPTYICGDLNVCHLDIDINNPVANRNKVAGFLNFEREQFQTYLDLGYKDVFRTYYPEEKYAYTWWSPFRKEIREKNIGWRLDYFLASHIKSNKSNESVLPVPKILDCEHLIKVMGSDHCPIKIILNMS